MNMTSAFDFYGRQLPAGSERYVTPAVIGAFLLVAVCSLSVLRSEEHPHFPAVGPGCGLFAGQIAALKSLTLVRHWVQDGYEKYKHKAPIFKVPMLTKWLVVVTSTDCIEELRKAPDDAFSFKEAVGQSLEADYTLGEDWRDEGPIHTALIKTRLTRSLADLFPCVIDEMSRAFEDELDVPATGWKTVPAVHAITRVVCRTSNRIFVGLPLCRNEEYVELNVKFTHHVIMSAMLLRNVPRIFKGIVGRYITPVAKTFKQAERIITPHIEERKKLMEEHAAEWADYADKPNDMLRWMLETLDERERLNHNLVCRMLRLNFAAIHTTALSFTFALYHIAAEPEKYQAPIRQEIHETLSREGWTKSAVEKLRRLDSLLRECQRYHGLGALSMQRVALRDYTFADGTFVRRGTTLSVPVGAIHRDSTYYPDPEVFHGFRFFDENDAGRDDVGLTNRLVSTSLEFLPFGHGKHACPGRFWAGNEMKAMMAYLLTNYDIKMEHEGVLPDEEWFGHTVIPNRHARIQLRRREAPSY